MALWQLVNLGTRCTVTHCRIALWSHQSAQTASSERCIMQIVNVSLRDSPPNPLECSTVYIWSIIYNRIDQCALPVTTIMALWQLVNLDTRCTVTHCRIALWSHQSAQTASSERCIMQIVNVSLIYIYIYITKPQNAKPPYQEALRKSGY